MTIWMGFTVLTCAVLSVWIVLGAFVASVHLEREAPVVAVRGAEWVLTLAFRVVLLGHERYQSRSRL